MVTANPPHSGTLHHFVKEFTLELLELIISRYNISPKIMLSKRSLVAKVTDRKSVG